MTPCLTNVLATLQPPLITYYNLLLHVTFNRQNGNLSQLLILELHINHKFIINENKQALKSVLQLHNVTMNHMTIILRRFSVRYARLTRVPCSGTTFVGSGSGPIDPTQNRPICVQSTQYSRLSERFYVEGESWDSKWHSGGYNTIFSLHFLFILAIVAGKTKEAGDVAGHWGFVLF